MSLAPIMLTVWNRADHARRTVAALQQNDLASESELFVFADGPKLDHTDDAGLQEVREFIRTIKGFKAVHIVEREENWGLAKSIINGATELTKKYGKVIVVEDDLVTSKGFLRYMNDALEVYKDEEKVMHVSGYMFPVRKDLPETVFYNTASTWGWATWDRAWKHFNNDIEDLNRKLLATKDLHRFNIEGNYNFYKQIEDNLSGKRITWGIRWYATMFLMDGFALHPGKSLVQNIGNDGSGTNSGVENIFWHSSLADRVEVKKLPIVESKEAREAMREFYAMKNKQATRSFPVRVKDRILRIVPRKFKAVVRLALKPQKRAEWRENRRLHKLPRYQEAEADFLGKRIKLLDAPSFLFQKHEIFGGEIYKFSSTSESPRIIDAGANIGLSVIYFKQLFPKARITTFEPEPHVAEVLRHNLTQFGYGDVEVVNKALWDEVTTLKFFAEGTDGGRLAEKQDQKNILEVQTDLLSNYLEEPIDFLKIDIEGAEAKVLHECKGKLSKVQNLFIEYHSMLSQPQTLHEILKLLSEEGFRYYITFVGMRQSKPYLRTQVNALGHDMQLNIAAVRK